MYLKVERENEIIDVDSDTFEIANGALLIFRTDETGRRTPERIFLAYAANTWKSVRLVSEELPCGFYNSSYGTCTAPKSHARGGPRDGHTFNGLRKDGWAARPPKRGV